MADNSLFLFRDKQGIPHISGSKLSTIFRGFGFAHGYDRQKQLVMWRAIAQGRLCELIEDSEENFRTDIFFRRMPGQLRHVERQLDNLSVEDLVCLEAYTAGINQAFSESFRLSHLFKGIKIEPWKLTDTLLLLNAIYYAADASLKRNQINFWLTLARSEIGNDNKINFLRKFRAIKDDDDIAALLPNHELNNVDAFNDVIEHLATLGFPLLFPNSTQVVSKNKSRTFTPLLAFSSPFFSNQIPDCHYLVNLESDSFYAMGVTLPGIPVIFSGRSASLSWGFTPDTRYQLRHLFEQCSMGQFKREPDDSWQTFTCRQEVIRRRNGGDYVLKVYENELGTALGDPWKSHRVSLVQDLTDVSGMQSLTVLMKLWQSKDVVTAYTLLNQLEFGWQFSLAESSSILALKTGFKLKRSLETEPVPSTLMTPVDATDTTHHASFFNAITDKSVLKNPADNSLTLPLDIPMRTLLMKGSTTTASSQLAHSLLNSHQRLSPAQLALICQNTYSSVAEKFLEILSPVLPDESPYDELKSWDCQFDEGNRGGWLFGYFYESLLAFCFERLGFNQQQFSPASWYLLRNDPFFMASLNAFLLDPGSFIYRRTSQVDVFEQASKAVYSCKDKTHFYKPVLKPVTLFGATLFHIPLRIQNNVRTLTGYFDTLLQKISVSHQGEHKANTVTSMNTSCLIVTSLRNDELKYYHLSGPSDKIYSRWFDIEKNSVNGPSRFKFQTLRVGGSNRKYPFKQSLLSTLKFKFQKRKIVRKNSPAIAPEESE